MTVSSLDPRTLGRLGRDLGGGSLPSSGARPLERLRGTYRGGRQVALEGSSATVPCIPLVPEPTDGQAVLVLRAGASELYVIGIA